MPPVDWSSLITDERGRVDYHRLGLLLACTLAFCGGLILLLVMASVVTANENTRWIAVGMVLPLTGVLGSTSFRRGMEMRRSRAIIAGAEPGRRAIDRGGSHADAHRR